MELMTHIWNIIEPLIFLAVVFLFFRDPIRRWNFFGYRPTAIMGLFDPHLQKVLFAKSNDIWSFNQGGIYDNNMYSTVKGILKRELGLESTRYKLVYTKPLGKVKIANKQLVNRARISTISVMGLRGKGYLACFLRGNLENVEKEITTGAGIQEVKLVSIDEARKLAKDFSNPEHSSGKQKMVLEMLDDIENYTKKILEYENSKAESVTATKSVDSSEELSQD